MKKIFLVSVLLLALGGGVFAATTTTNYGLTKPGVGDTGWGDDVNTNFDTIDSQMKINSDAGVNVTCSGTTTYMDGEGGCDDISSTYQPLDSELTTISGLAETNGNVMFVAGGAWTSDATPAIDCTDCTNVPVSHDGTITWTGTSILESGVAFQFGDATDATLTHTYANTGTNVDIAYSTGAMDITGSLTATNLSGTNTGDNDEVGTLTTGDLCVNDGSSVNCTVNTEAELETALDSLDVVAISTDDVSSANLITAVSDETGSGLLMFGTAPTITTSLSFNAVTDTVAGIQNQNLVDKTAAEDISGVWEVQDDTLLNIGNDADFEFEFDATADLLANRTAKTVNAAAGTIENALFTIAADTGAAGMTADQEIFEIGKGGDDDTGTWTELFSIDEDGDLEVAGTITTSGAGQSSLSEGLVVNNNGGTASTDDFRAEGGTEDQLFVVDASTDNILMGDFDTNYIQVAKTGIMTFVGTGALSSPIINLKADFDGSAVNDDDCTGEQGLMWYDDTDSAFEFCNANSGAPTELGGVETNDLETTDPPNVLTGEFYLGTGSGTGNWTKTFTDEIVVDDLGIEFVEGDTITNCSNFSTTGGAIFYDDSDGKLKKCEDNVMSDLDTSGSHTGTITWGGTAILESGTAFQFGDGTDATLTHTYSNTGTDVTIAYSTAAMAITGALTATSYGGVTEANLVDKTAAEDVSGVWEIQDNTAFNFGNGADFEFEFDATADLLALRTADTTTGAIENAHITFAVDTGAATMTADQEVFEIGKGGDDDSGTWTELFAVDEDGDTSMAGSLTITGDGSQSTITEGLVVNSGGAGDADDDFVAQGDTKTTLLTVDASEDDVEIDGHLETTGTAPAASSCGTTPTVASTSTDMGGKVTVGTTASDTCTLTFDTAWANAPSCTVIGEDSAITLGATTTTTTLVITCPGADDFSSDVLMYNCFGQE